MNIVELLYTNETETLKACYTFLHFKIMFSCLSYIHTYSMLVVDCPPGLVILV